MNISSAILHSDLFCIGFDSVKEKCSFSGSSGCRLIFFVQTDRSDDEFGDIVRVAVRRWTTIFEVSTTFFVALTRNANRRSPTGHARTELMDLNERKREGEGEGEEEMVFIHWLFHVCPSDVVRCLCRRL